MGLFARFKREKQEPDVPQDGLYLGDVLSSGEVVLAGMGSPSGFAAIAALSSGRAIAVADGEIVAEYRPAVDGDDRSAQRAFVQTAINNSEGQARADFEELLAS